MKKSPEAFRTISEVAEWLGTPTHVLRFWESRFTQVKPVKRAGGRRYYRPADMELLGGIKKLLHTDGMTIRGVQKLLREEGVRHVAALSLPIDVSAAIEGSSSTVEDIARIGAAEVTDVEEAPIVLNVVPEPLENVIPFAEPDVTAVVEKMDAETAAFEKAQAESDPAPAPEDPAPAAFKPVEEAEAEAEAEETAPEVPEVATSFEIDLPDDPEDDDDTAPGITRVAAALRGQAKFDQHAKPSPEVFSELYGRLVGLRDRMDSRD